MREENSKQSGTPGTGGKTTVIPKSALPGAKTSGTAKSGSDADEDDAKTIDPKTVALPMVSDTSDAKTTILPVQRPDEQATQKMRFEGKTGAAQGAARPADSAGTSAPSPADAQPTVPEQPRPQQAPSGQQAPGGTQSFTAPEQFAAETHTIAAPQRIPGAPGESSSEPKRRSRRSLLIAGAAVVLIVVVIGVIIAMVGGGSNSPEAKVKAAITTYTNALNSGNLTDLQAATCGAQNDFYKGMAKSPDQYASVHKLAVDQRKIPKVDSVNSVQITGDKAVAQASVYTDADATRIARTFDLQNTVDGWKVCDLPNAAQ
ncbi:Rv0361 family membrane protein [Nocardia miyunensis]|uniref:Rv0361 family membrane protein n=1 Tax=Nocardia miyunensis TaxID=282684 RepID=UPI0012F4CFDB|nr:hypothetical protein [Nocardia miyunensis]